MLRKFCLTLLLGAALAGLGATQASAFEGNVFGSAFGPGGPGVGEFQMVDGVAVDQNSGDVYVYDDGTHEVYRFGAAGEPVDFTGLAGNAITEVGGAWNDEEELAVDSSTGPDHGDLYVANNNEVRIYDDTTGALLGTLSGGEMCGVAVDAAGNVYVGIYGNTVNEYIPQANPVTNADYVSSLYGLSGVCNVAADAAGDLYTISWGGSARKYAPSQFNTSEKAAVTTPPETEFDPRGNTLAVDLATEEVYADEAEDVAQFSPEGLLLSRFGETGSGQVSGSHGVAVNSATGTVYASNGRGSVDVYTRATLPDTNTGAPSNLASNSVTLNGDVEDPGAVAGGVGYHFFYTEGSSCSAYGEATATGDATGSGDVAEQTTVGGLRAHNQYTACFVTTAQGTSVLGRPVHFTTASVAPTILSTTSSAVRSASATLEASVNPQKEATSCAFQYVTQAEFESSGYAAASTIPCEPGTLEGGEPVGASAAVTGLSAATVYHYRVQATNATGQSTGADQTLTTLPLPAQVTTGEAQPAAGGGEQVAGVVDPGGNGLWTTTYRIEYGLTAEGAQEAEGSAGGDTAIGLTPAVAVGSGDSPVSVSAVLPALDPGSYRYRVFASNAGGQSVGAYRTFTVTGGGPAVGTEATQFVDENSAIVLAAVNPAGLATSYEVQYGTTTAYGSGSGPLTLAPAMTSQGTIVAIAGLAPGTTYHYRLVATSAAGTAYGADATFTTTGTPLTTAFTSFAIPSTPQIAVMPFAFPGESGPAQAEGKVKKAKPKAKRPKHKAKKRHRPKRHKR